MTTEILYRMDVRVWTVYSMWFNGLCLETGISLGSHSMCIIIKKGCAIYILAKLAN
jgi:hypothetical protein